MARPLPALLLSLLLLAGCGESRGQGSAPPPEGESCRDCHARLHPGLVADLARSPHERVPVRCETCHGDDHDAIFAAKGAVPPTVCARCHEREAAEFGRGRHGRELQPGSFETLREYSFAVGGCTTATGCHSIQKPYPDGSVGRCGSCHPTHAFANHGARDPRLCHECHGGGDHSEYEAWRRSAHSLESPSGAGPIADCVTCHDTHDVSGGVTHGLSPLATGTPPLFVPTVPREEFLAQRERMLARCRPCHGARFAREALAAADRWRRRGAVLVEEAARIVARMYAKGLLAPPPESRVPNPVHGAGLRLSGAMVYDLDASEPERIYYDMRFHLYPAMWRGAYHVDPERFVWEWNDALKSALDRLREIERSRSERPK